MATWSSHNEKRAQRMKPSELRNAFALAKQHAARESASSRIIGFVDAHDHTARVTSAVPVHRSLFDATPAEVWIDTYTPFHPLTLKLSFRNCDTVARRLRIEPPQSPFFRIAPWPSTTTTTTTSKVAAGMDIAFELTFAPHDVANYAIDLVCITERERFRLPVRARGPIAALDLPDCIDFGHCVVKLPTTKVLTVRNVGSRAATFAFAATSAHVRVTPPSAALATASNSSDAVQLEVAVTPVRCSDSDVGELVVTDDSGACAVVQLVCKPVTVNVYLSAPLVTPAATYLSLTSRERVQICNDSDVALDFSWRACADSAREDHERTALLDELAQMESAELEQLDAETDSVEVHTMTAYSPFDARRAVEHKYQLLRKAALEDVMQFADECFALAPLAGRVWPHASVDVAVRFAPQSALLYTSVAFLEVAGQDVRLPLQLRGQGIGPRAQVVYNELLDFGDVFISDERTLAFTVQNTGEIPATFELLESIDALPTTVALHVRPPSATLDVHAMRTVDVSFCAHALGAVATTLRFALVGSTDVLSVRFRATVVPPVLHVDVDSIEFGAVAYSFAYVRTFTLVSASKITVKYALRIAEEAAYRHKEFALEPADGELAAYGTQSVRVLFTSLSAAKAYDYRLVVSVAGVGSDLLSVPVRAHCLVPDVVLAQPELDYGTSFVRFAHTQMLVLTNRSSHLAARFTISEQDDHSRAIATFTVSDWTGTIDPESSVEVAIALACDKLGAIRLPLTVTIAGSTELPLAATLTTTAIGPTVAIEPLELQYGNCTCLVDHSQTLQLTNTSAIPAPFKTFIRNARSKFIVDCHDGVLAPGASLDIVVVANVDDTIVFKDHLHVLVAEGANVVVPLTIKGVGTTMWTASELRVVDFGHQLTHAACEWRCTLENKGKRPQVLTWVNRTAAARLKQLEAAAGTGSANTKRTGLKASTNSAAANVKSAKVATSATATNSSDSSIDASAVPVFSVFPTTIELKPRTACVFVFKGLSPTPGRVTEALVCETRVGKDKQSKVAFATDVVAHFVAPQLAPSTSLLAFEYVHRPGTDIIARQSQPLTLTNVCELPLAFTLRTQTPFALDCWEAALAPGEHVDVSVEFYPGFRDDHVCRVLHSKVTVAYTGHPARDAVDIVGDISFPNLAFETTRVDFGCVLNDTQRTVAVAVTNVSKVDTTFRWVFLSDTEAPLTTTTLSTAKKGNAVIPVNQVFDILPIRGCLRPGESENVEFVFYGHANRKFRATVACEVDGGPEYELALVGEASSLVYKLDKQSLDFGPVLFNKTEDREFAILNVGKVPFSFAIASAPQLQQERRARGRIVDVSPASGRIAPNDKQKVVVRLRPGVPEPFDETLVLEVAHFEPLAFPLVGVGIFAAVHMNLPREPHAANVVRGEPPKWRELKKSARRNLERSTLTAAAVAASSGGTSNSGLMVPSDSRSTISTLQVSKSVVSSQQQQQRTSGGPHSPTRALGTSSSSGPLIDDLDVEIEACRLFFTEFLLAQESKRVETKARIESTASALPVDTPQQQQDGDDEHVRAAEPTAKATSTAKATHPSAKTRTLTKPQQPEQRIDKPAVATAPMTTKTRSSSSADSAFPFVLSHFVLDFGNVVVGTHRIRKFTITNLGPVPASFQLDKNAALARGFQVEPERVVRLPEKQAVEFTVTFQARKQTPLGIHEAQLAVAMKNGPPSVLTIRAYVTVPDVALSLETLDFGRMAVSTCHTLVTQLSNPSAVTAEWAVKKPMGSARDVPNFRITPSSGVLAPGYKANVVVEFVPDDSRHFALKLPIKVAANPKLRSITCRGEGAELRLSFDPPMLELGPMLPCASAVERVVAMHNDSDYAVEVVALDFDEVLHADEALLRQLTGYSADGTLNLPLRTPGQPLSAYLLENGLLSADSVDATMGRDTVLAEDDDEIVGDARADSIVITTETVSTASELTNQLEQGEGTAATTELTTMPRRVLDYVLLGPPRCGKSTQAQLLAEKENVIVWTIDDAVRRVCLEPSALGTAVRVALGLISADNAVVASEVAGAPDQADSDAVAAGLSGHSSASEITRDALLPSSKSSETPESNEALPSESLLASSSSASLTRSSSSSSTESIAALLGDILQWRLAQPDLQRGGVLDGFDSVFVPLSVAVAACAKALAAARVIVLSFDDDSYDAMAAMTLRADEARGFKSVSVMPVASRDRLVSTSEGTVETMHESDDSVSEQQAVDEPSSSFEQLQQQSEIAETADGPSGAVEDGAFTASTLAAFRDGFDCIAAAAAQSQPRPQTFAEYCSSFETTRRCIVSDFLVRESELQNSASGSALLSSSSANSAEPARRDAAIDKHVLRDWMRPDNFWLDVPITEPGAALFVHNVVFAAVDKCVRELESSHLTVPAPAKYQVVRRPTERFPRKPVTRFRILECRAAPSAGGSSSNTVDDSNQQDDDASKDADLAAATAGLDGDTSASTLSSTLPPAAATTRWVIPARSKLDIVVQFASADVGVFDCSLGFEIVGVRREFPLFCRGVCAVPSLNSDPRNVFMSRVKSRPDGAFVAKKFVLARNQFEFGPLIVLSQSSSNPTVSVPPATESDFALCMRTSPSNVEVFRMSNTSAFRVHVDFCLALDATPSNDAPAFALYPPQLELAEGETKELWLWASPPSDGLHENSVVCCVEDNPEPVVFAVSCFGCTPALELHGPWEQPAASSTSEVEAAGLSESPRTLARESPRTSARDGHSVGSTMPSMPPPPVLDFAQLLLKRTDEKTFIIENVSAVAVAWRLLAPDLPPDFRLAPIDGTLKPLQKTSVLAVFTATTEATYRFELAVEFSDADSALRVPERTRQLPLVLAAEAYKIDVSSFDRDSDASTSAADGSVSDALSDGSLDFGLVRVGERHVRSFSIRNRGKYDIQYVVAVRTPAARALFDVAPRELVLAPGAAASVSVTFVSTRDVALRDCRDIRVTIIEMLSREPCREFVVRTTVRAVYSVFRVQPSRGLTFGPLKYSDAPRTKRVEIRNDGEFPFRFRVRAASAADDGPLTLETALHASALAVGQFTVAPDCGTVDPGVVAALDVTFAPRDCRVYRELLRIDVSGCDPLATATELQQYELVAESCYPGIATSDYESIFEEQIVVRSVGASASSPSARMSSESTSSPSLLSSQSVVFAELEKLFSFGAMLATASAKGAVERFKITNPTKVSTTVHFTVTPTLSASSALSASTTDAAGQSLPQAFTVQPAVWEIPPLEHRFVSVYFKPTAIASYRAAFSARVDDSPSTTSTATTSDANDMTLLAFELCGEGTMPCISVVEPTLRDAATGALVLDFGRVRVAKARDLQLVLRNDGIVAATVLFALATNANFGFALGNGSLALAPRASELLSVQFKPQRAHDEPVVSTLKLTVHSNPFDETSVRLIGSGFRDDVVFEDLPMGHDDELHFDDIELSVPHEATMSDTTGTTTSLPRTDVKVFSLCNQSSEPIRFAWPVAPPFAFAPAVGHLQPRAYKLIRATFAPGTPSLDVKASAPAAPTAPAPTARVKTPIQSTPTAPAPTAPAPTAPTAVVFAPHIIALETQRIAYKDALAGSRSDWDDSARTVSFDGTSSGSDAALPEPAFDAVSAPSIVRLQCFAAADALAFECDTTAIHFKRTFMLEACSHRVTVRNTSRIRLAVAWHWEHVGATTSGADGFDVLSSTGDAAIDMDECPFEISPDVSTLAPESAQVFTVKFAPMEVDEFNYALVLHAASASASTGDTVDSVTAAQSLRIDVRGASLRPACHFDVERSDYATRRAAHLVGPHGELGPLDASVHVLEMASLGVRVRNTKRFFVVNPTNVSYEFTWTPVGSTATSSSASCFRCATPRGLMLAGKRCEMVFEFTPQQLALEEMFWVFAVPHFDVRAVFLLVGTTTEPRVLLERGSVNFNTLLVGTKATQTVALVNHEDMAFHFVLDRAALDFGNSNPDAPPALVVHPLSGVVPPHGRASIDIEFAPSEEKAYSVNVSCLVKRKPTRLSLNVKGEGYSIHDALTLAARDDRSNTQPVLLGTPTVLDFGAVRVHEALERVVTIHNTGKFGFEFSWSTGTGSGAGTIAKLPPALSIEPMQGTVKKTDKVACRITFAPTKHTTLDGLQLVCTVAGARAYVFALAGAGVPPSVQFSFVTHDFGACFVAAPDAPALAETAHLRIFNADADVGVDLDCAFENKPHLRVTCAPMLLGPRAAVDVPIVFTARHEGAFADVVPFTLNGTTTVNVSVRGEGVAPKVELVNPAMQIVALSALQIGQQATRSVKIVNRSKRKITVTVAPDDSVDDSPTRSLAALGLAVVSMRELTLRPKETTDVEFRFAPTMRIAAFETDVFIDVAGSRRKLVTLTGCCLGMDVALDADVLAFGTVCLGSQLVRTVKLQNRGDVAARFQWHPRDFAPDFSVAPVDGVVAPNDHKTFDVTFRPAAANPDVRYDQLACAIDGAAAVYLTLTGSCVLQATSSIHELAFASRVREAVAQTIVLENRTSAPWHLFPVVTGEHWSCQESVTVPIDGRTSVDIVYRPLRMTASTSNSDDDAVQRPERLEGSVFFAIPDGTALLYNVVGTASAPAVAGTLTLTTPAKKTLVVALAVTNWLATPQTFDVAIMQTFSATTPRDVDADSDSVRTTGPPTFVVQGNATRTYSFKVFAYTERDVALRVTFRNPATGEYVLYHVRVAVTRASVVETLHLDAPVRQTLTRVVTIENPLPSDRTVHFVDPTRWWTCSSAAVRVKQLVALSGRAEGSYEIEYRPLVWTNAPVEAELTIAFAELGDYTYRLILATQRAGNERTLRFSVSLGSAQTQLFAFTTFADKPTEAECSMKTTPASFTVPNVVKIEPAVDWDGCVTSVPITFEPETLGVVRDVLTIGSPSVGEYTCALEGVAVPPLPQGPIVVTSTRDIEFRNVFSTATDFDVVVDNARFVVAVKTLAIAAKSSKVVTVKLDPTAVAGSKPGAGLTGKLFISCSARKELPPWIYYLEAPALLL